MSKIVVNDKPPPGTVGSRLEYARERNGLSQIAAALRLGHKTAVQLNRWERDAYTPGGRNLRKLSELYGVTPDWILNGTAVNRTVPRGTVRETPGAYGDAWSALVARTEREALRRGRDATDAEADFLRAALELPEARALAGFDGGEIGPEAIAFTQSLLDWIALRHGALPTGVEDEVVAGPAPRPRKHRAAAPPTARRKDAG